MGRSHSHERPCCVWRRDLVLSPGYAIVVTSLLFCPLARRFCSVLPSQYPEVKSYPHLRKLLAEHIDMQFEDIRLLLRQPRGATTVGANFATAALLFNVISGASVCFYKTSWAGFTSKTGSGKKFKRVLRDHFPFADIQVAQSRTIQIFYDYSRNPLAHSFGLGDPTVIEVLLAKNKLTQKKITELEDSPTLPVWSRAALTETGIQTGPPSYRISTSGLYWGVHRMLQSIFAAKNQAVEADRVAKRLGF